MFWHKQSDFKLLKISDEPIPQSAKRSVEYPIVFTLVV